MPLQRKISPKIDLDVVTFDRCAAKTTPSGQAGTTVLEHCRNVGFVARELHGVEWPGLQRLLPSNVGLAAAVHDVGKVSPGFQLKYFADLVGVLAPAIRQLDFCRFETKHANIGAAAIDHWLGKSRTTVAIAAAGHHGSIDRNYACDDAEIHGGASWAKERARLIEVLVSLFGPLGLTQMATDVSPAVLAGLVSVADWIGSDERFFPSDSPPVAGDSEKTAAFAVSDCGLRVPPLRRDLTFEQVFKFAPHPVQAGFIDLVDGPGLYVLEAPMGLGKTEAALFAAYKLLLAGHNKGLYFALPTRLTSDRIHERVGQFLDAVSTGEASPLLAHGLAWLRAFDDCGGRYAPGRSEWFGPLKRAMLAPYAVGTIDQALLAVLRVRHNFVRTYGLAGKVVILDEVHSYDMYTGTLLDQLVQRLIKIGCSVIVLSATLTASRRARLAPALVSIDSKAYPLAVRANTRCEAVPLARPPDHTCHTRIEPWDAAAVSRAAVDAAAGGQCVVCMANTVDRAQAWYRAVVAERPENAFDVGLLHARFPLFQREILERQWVESLGKDGKRPRGCVLVATQIAEQSIDIDADFMITELAPADMLLQRMGRLWRHPRGTRPCKAAHFVVVADNPLSAATREETVERLGRENSLVYAPYVLFRTYAVWSEMRKIVLPHDIRPTLEAVYSEPASPEHPHVAELRANMLKTAEHLSSLAAAAGDNVYGMPTANDHEEDAPTRYSDLPTQQALLVQSIEASTPFRATVTLMNGETLALDEFRPDGRATFHLHRNLVALPRYLLPQELGIKRWLAKHFFRPPPVLLWRPGDGSLSCDGNDTRLGYRSDTGIYRTDRTGDSSVRTLDKSPAFDPFDKHRLDW